MVEVVGLLVTPRVFRFEAASSTTQRESWCRSLLASFVLFKTCSGATTMTPSFTLTMHKGLLTTSRLFTTDVGPRSPPPRFVFYRCQVYIGHEQWPRSGSASISDGGVLEILAAWARSTVEISVLLARAGGSPEALCHYSKTHAGLLAAVVPVHDEYVSIQRDPKINFKRG